MRIGVIGGGTVGWATARAFIEHVDEVRVWDSLVERRTSQWLGPVLACDLVFICLPEQKVEGWFAEIGTGNPKANYVLRSTVPVGTTRGLRENYGLANLVHSPEFLTARCSITDAHLPARNIIGLPLATHRPTDGELCPHGEYRCFMLLRDLYRKRFPGVPIHELSSDESEAVKLIQNSFFAVKVAFFNEARAFCDRVGLYWDRVLEAVLADGRIAHAHTKVPGPDGLRGFGGACLPKDLAQWINCLQDAGCKATMAFAAQERNMIDRGSKQ